MLSSYGGGGTRWCSVLFLIVLEVIGCFGGDPYVFLDWTVSYINVSPLGTNQKVTLFLLWFFILVIFCCGFIEFVLFC